MAENDIDLYADDIDQDFAQVSTYFFFFVSDVASFLTWKFTNTFNDSFIG